MFRLYINQVCPHPVNKQKKSCLLQQSQLTNNLSLPHWATTKQSAQAIVKEFAAKRGEVDHNKCRHFVKLTLKKMVEKKLITQVKGHGATGSFKLIKTATVKPKKVVKKVLKKVAKKPVAKKTVAKKVVARKTAAKKAPEPSGAAKKAVPAKKTATKKAPKTAAGAKKAPTKRVIKQAAKAYRDAPVASAKKAKK